jgi:hypothetical protein
MQKQKSTKSTSVAAKMAEAAKFHKYNDLLAQHKAKSENIASGLEGSPLAVMHHLIAGLVTKSLVKKAQKEDQKNRDLQMLILDTQAKNKLREKERLAEIAALADERKFERSHLLDLAKEKRHHENELEKESRADERQARHAQNAAAITDALRRKDEARREMAKSFENPADAYEFLNEPEKIKSRIEKHDINPMTKKMFMGALAKLGVANYEPKIKLRLRKEK